MNFTKSNEIYEKWLSRQLKIVPADLKKKHELMAAAVFPFLRATFFRWAQIWPEVCADCATAPQVLAVGDLHVENFGTWRDVEGRLVWGINDLDEVCRMPYTIDLVRLASSAHFAIDVERLRIDHGEACGAILTGYREGLEAGGMPWILAGKHQWLHDMVEPGMRDAAAFWGKLNGLAPVEGPVPASALRGIDKMMPGKISGKYRIVHRVAGLGSLGRQRFVAIAEHKGGFVCREAKALAPSAWAFAQGAKSDEIRYQKALDIAVRAPDPFVRAQGNWIVRRLAPDCARVDLALFPREREETKLLHAMGWETANLHLGSRQTDKLREDLDKRAPNWLHKAAAKMVNATKTDWNEWRSAEGIAQVSSAGNKARKAGKV